MVKIDTLFRPKQLKNHTFSEAHTYIAYVKNYPPGAKKALQILSLAAYASETHEKCVLESP